MPKSPRLIRRVAEKPGALAAVRIHAEPVHRDREWYRPENAAQRQFTVDDPAAVGVADAGGAVARRRVVLDLEEFGDRRWLPLLGAGVDGREVDPAPCTGPISYAG